jgi:uncharacterized Fe-S radical SAM superfamily protein PflX
MIIYDNLNPNHRKEGNLKVGEFVRENIESLLHLKLMFQFSPDTLGVFCQTSDIEDNSYLK